MPVITFYALGVNSGIKATNTVLSVVYFHIQRDNENQVAYVWDIAS